MLFSLYSFFINHTLTLFSLFYNKFIYHFSPGVVGMLWEVTDTDTDYLTTEFLSSWIPSNAPIHWKHVNKDKWRKADKIGTFNALLMELCSNN